jgi:hypothetical protein
MVISNIILVETVVFTCLTSQGTSGLAVVITNV